MNFWHCCASWWWLVESVECWSFQNFCEVSVLNYTVIMAIHLYIVAVSLSAVDLLNALHSVWVVCYRPDEAPEVEASAKWCLVIRWYPKLKVLRQNENFILQYVKVAMCLLTVMCLFYFILFKFTMQGQQSLLAPSWNLGCLLDWNELWEILRVINCMHECVKKLNRFPFTN